MAFAHRLHVRRSGSLGASEPILRSIEYLESRLLLTGLPNDPEILDNGNLRWYLDKLQMDDVWAAADLGTFNLGDGVVVGSLEGFNYFHEDIADNVWINAAETPGNDVDDDENGYVDDYYGWNFYEDEPNESGGSGHGMVASVAIATTDNGLGIAGTAGASRVVNGLNASEEAIDYFREIGGRVIWVSVVGGADGVFNSALAEYAYQQGVLLIGGLGNTTGTIQYLPDAPHTLSLTGTQFGTGEEAIYGHTAQKIDLAVPARTIRAAEGSDSYSTAGGQSYAGPLAAGVAALLFANYPTWSVDQVVARLLGTADNIDNEADNELKFAIADHAWRRGIIGAGRINAFRALDVAGTTLPAPTIEFVDVPGFDFDSNTQYYAFDHLSVYSRGLYEPSTVVDPDHWQLLYDGGDGQFGNGNDAEVPITLETNYSIGSRWIHFSIDDPQNLAEGGYRFTAWGGSGGLVDPFGTPMAQDFSYEFDFLPSQAAAPDVVVTGGQTQLRGEPVEFVVAMPVEMPGVPASPSTPEQQQYNVAFDWDGDGNFDESMVRTVDLSALEPQTSFAFYHTFDVPLWNPQLRIKVSGAGGLETPVFSTALTLEAFEITSEGGVETLRVFGTSEADSISLVDTGSAQYTLTISTPGLADVIENVPNSIDAVFVDARAGADTIAMDSAITIPATLAGGDGDDVIEAGNGNSSLLGGAGNDEIVGGTGNDTIKPGSDSDTVYAGEGDDFVQDFGTGKNALFGEEGHDEIQTFWGDNLIAGGAGDDVVWFGTVNGDNTSVVIGGDGSDDLIGGAAGSIGPLLIAGSVGLDEAGLFAIWDEWSDPDPQHTRTERMANLSGTGTGPRENGDYFLIPGDTVHDDGDVDSLSGQFAWSWSFFAFGQDGDPPSSSSEATSTNLREADIAAPDAAVRGQPVTFVLDAGETPTSSGDYYFDIDWDGDDQIDESIPGGEDVDVPHVFTHSSMDPVEVSIFVRSETGATALETIHEITISPYLLLPDEENAELMNFVYGGTEPDGGEPSIDGADHLFVFLGIVGPLFGLPSTHQLLILQDVLDGVDLPNTGAAVVPVNGVTGKVIIYGQGGIDLLVSDLVSTVPFEIDGGDGDDLIVGSKLGDTLLGGAGNDSVFGGDQALDGDDFIFGGAGDDVLYGWWGADSIDGGAGEDLIIGGARNITSVPLFVWDVGMVWYDGPFGGGSSEPFQDRVDALLGTLLSTGPGGNLLDDDAADLLIGGLDLDWFLYNMYQDLVDDEEEDEVLTHIL